MTVTLSHLCQGLELVQGKSWLCLFVAHAYIKHVLCCLWLVVGVPTQRNACLVQLSFTTDTVVPQLHLAASTEHCGRESPNSTNTIKFSVHHRQYVEETA